MSKCYNSELPIGPQGPQGPPGTSPTITSTDGSIEIDNTNPSAPDLSIPHGTWIPVFSQETANITVGDSSGAATYFRVGDIVFFTMTISLGISSGTTATFESTIPVASIFNSGGQGSIGISGTMFNEDSGFLKRFEMSTNGIDGGLLFSVDWQNDSSGGFNVIQIVGQYNVQTA